MWGKTDFLNKAFGILLTLLIVFTVYSLIPLIESVIQFIALVSYPFILAMILYYFLRPLVRILERKITIYPAIWLTLVLLAAFFTFVVIFIYPTIKKQITLFFQEQPSNLMEMISQGRLPATASDLKDFIKNALTHLNSIIMQNISTIFSIATQFVVSLVTVPFILFYMLKDDKVIFKGFFNLIPEKYLRNAKDFFDEIDATLIHFINGRFVVSIIISTLLLISFLSIGLNYPFLLYIYTLIFFIIPTIGAFMAAILPLVVAFSMSNLIGFEVLAVMLAASTLEGFVVTPKIMGLSLYIHPLTIMLVLLAAGLMYGVLGLIIATPLYALLKVVFKHLSRFMHEHP